MFGDIQAHLKSDRDITSGSKIECFVKISKIVQKGESSVFLKENTQKNECFEKCRIQVKNHTKWISGDL